PEALLQGFQHIEDCQVHVVTCTQRPMRSPEKLADNIFFHSIHVPKLGWMRTGYQGCIRAVRRKLRELKPDVVHGQGTERDCALEAVFSGYPNVLTIHGNMRLISRVNEAKPFSYEWLAAKLERFTVPRSNGVVCITRYTQEAMAPLAKRTWVLPNAVDETFFSGSSPRRADPPTILCIGVVMPRKNQNRFITALDPLAKKHRFRVLFIGAVPEGRPFSNEFRDLIRERSWCEHLDFSGRDRIREELSKAWMLALPSLEDNCPMAVLEAMAAQIPVVAANVGGVPDLVEPNVNGLFCDPLDLTSMREAVERLLVDRNLAEQLAARGRETAQARFHPQVVARKHLEIYRDVLATRR
ncbi:MAG TPA: glycosyltransferase family 4 protein, partial [Candidatus Acidoferrum sp.]|nr:glycosyltransferase family 4 protein [Candidatus Acidoferrum sp.]